MAVNQKLAGVIKGRTISGTQNQDDRLTISFTDGSQLTVTTAGSSNSASTGGTVTAVRQEEATVFLDMEDGSIFTIPMASTDSSIEVQDNSGAAEYVE